LKLEIPVSPILQVINGCEGEINIIFLPSNKMTISSKCIKNRNFNVFIIFILY